MAFPPAFLDEIRTRLPLNRLVERKVRLEKRGRDFKGLCPFHNEKTPSFHVFADHYHCYGCGAHGDHFRWVMETEKASFPEAVERLAGEAGLEVPRASPEAAEAARRLKDLHEVADAVAAAFERRLWLPDGAAALAYLRRRGLSDATIRRFRLGWSGEGRGALAADLARDGITPDRLVAIGAMKQDEGRAPVDLFFGRVMFPILDPRGRVIAFGGRVLGDAVPKYVNSPETQLFRKGRTLYGAHIAREALRAGQRLAVVEGYMDVIALAEAGHGAAVAPLGTALTEEHLAALWRLDPCPVLCFDGDAAGARAAERVMALALPHLEPGRSLGFVGLPGGEDPDTYIRRHGLSGFAALMERVEPLATALFMAITKEKASTPEQRAAQRSRLRQYAMKISNSTLRAEYIDHFEAAWLSSKSRPPKGNDRPKRQRPFAPIVRLGPRPQLDQVTPRARLERRIVATFVETPPLIAHRLERLGTCEFVDPAASDLRDALCAHANALFGLDSAQAVDHLRMSGAGQLIEAVMPFSGRPQRVKARTLTSVKQLAILDTLFRRLEIDVLKNEIADAKRAVELDPDNDAKHARLAQCIRALEHAAEIDDKMTADIDRINVDL